jgi:hypothetical protein
MDHIEDYLEVGINEKLEVVINLPHDMTRHIVFSPNQAKRLAGVLVKKAEEAEAAKRASVGECVEFTPNSEG